MSSLVSKSCEERRWYRSGMLSPLARFLIVPCCTFFELSSGASAMRIERTIEPSFIFTMRRRAGSIAPT